jgi:hypothetical protein
MRAHKFSSNRTQEMEARNLNGSGNELIRVPGNANPDDIMVLGGGHMVDLSIRFSFKRLITNEVSLPWTSGFSVKQLP